MKKIKVAIKAHEKHRSFGYELPSASADGKMEQKLNRITPGTIIPLTRTSVLNEY
ncbi:MAG: hypothetical protein K9G70_09970 [Prolixibacteraceae bacterium]|nr:hypothetical protein [Prolixibacteraceae bacterium]